MLHEILNWCENFIRERKELVILEIILVAIMLPVAVCVTPHPVPDHIAFISVQPVGGSTMRTKELKPCPWCGSEVKLRFDGVGNVGKWVSPIALLPNQMPKV